MNWTVDNNGTYDYAANTRGYTYGAILDFEERNWGVRFGELLMPKVANGEQLDASMARARAENIEFEFRPTLLKGRKTVFRALHMSITPTWATTAKRLTDSCRGLVRHRTS